MPITRLAPLLVAGCIWSSIGAAQNQPEVPTAATPGPALKAALSAAEAALRACSKLSQNVAVTLIDSAGTVKLVLASDGASPRGVQSSTNKALTSLAFKLPTSALAAKSANDPELAAKLAANTAFNTHAGGLIVSSGDELIGAIGVGGAKGSEKDEACAEEGRNVLLKKIKRH
jgi:uncharacterized protein GlcG (DUF336 family)